jgi:formylglycine-generating enzyme required for sulfatase activity
VRLPTGPQWERVARGESGRLFPWGNATPDDHFLNFTARSSEPLRIRGENRSDKKDLRIGRPTPVGFYPAGATPEGVLDMAGNVFEWCADEVAPSWRAVRGGCFQSVAFFVRASFKGRYEASTRRDIIGFRTCAVAV